MNTNFSPDEFIINYLDNDALVLNFKMNPNINSQSANMTVHLSGNTPDLVTYTSFSANLKLVYGCDNLVTGQHCPNSIVLNSDA